MTEKACFARAEDMLAGDFSTAGDARNIEMGVGSDCGGVDTVPTDDFAPNADMPDVEIRVACSRDRERFMEMRLECLRAVYGLPKDFAFDGEFVAKHKEFFEKGDHVTVFALDADGNCLAVASLCFINMMPTLDNPTGRRAHLMNVYVRPAARRRGIAKRLVSRLVEEAKSRGATEITLDATEEGRPLYESLGFEGNEEAMRLVLR